MSEVLSVSVIVPSRGNDHARKTVEGLTHQTIPAADYEVILVSPPSSLARNPPAANVRSVTVDRLHPPGQMRNLGAAKAKGERLFFLDDDCIPPSDWIEKMRISLDSDRAVGAVGCRCVSLDCRFMSRCADYALFAPSQLRRSEYRDLGAAALAVRKEAFVLSGGFNPEWRASEDWDFCLRLRARGWRCFFDPSAEVRHDHGRKTFTAIIRSAYCSGFASGLNVQRRHYDRLSWLAKLSVRMSSPPAYALLLLPYAFAVAALQGVESVRDDPQSLVFVPFMCAGRIAFHFGVWRRLVADRHRPPTTA